MGISTHNVSKEVRLQVQDRNNNIVLSNISRTQYLIDKE
jgi:hypothetical protein